MTRPVRWFWRVAIVIAGVIGFNLALSGAEPSAQARVKNPPNIVFIFSDDHAYQAISAYNDPRRLVDTPNMDRLGKEGMRFDRCIVPNSICGPSRASVLTGKYSHLNGFYNNTNSRFDGSQTTFPEAASGGRLPDGYLRQMAPGHLTRPALMSGTSCQGRGSTTTLR